jgi:hypothetical protein
MSLVYVLREANEQLPGSNGLRSNLYKIGVANSLEERIAALQTGNPRPIEAVQSFPTPDSSTAFYLENILHNQNAKHRVPGSEWFYFSDVALHEVLDAAASQQCQLEGLMADEKAYGSIIAVSDVRDPDADESDRFLSVKATLLEPQSQDKQHRARLDAHRRLFAFRKVLLKVPSLSEVKLQQGSRRFDVTEFRKQHGELVTQFMRPGVRSFRWALRAQSSEKSDDSLLEDAATSARAILEGGDVASHRDVADRIHESLRGLDERDIMAQLRELTMNQARREVPERLERAWFASRVGSAAGITGICSCAIGASRVDLQSLQGHLNDQDPALLERFMRTSPSILKVSTPNGGIELDSREDD